MSHGVKKRSKKEDPNQLSISSFFKNNAPSCQIKENKDNIKVLACELNNSSKLKKSTNYSANLSKQDNESNDKATGDEDEQKIPYYLENFNFILNSVLDDKDNKSLLNDEDLSVISSFQNQSDLAQRLYVRLFQRKQRWLRISKLQYPDIANDLMPVLEEIQENNLIEIDTPDELSTALELMSVVEIKNLMKSFNIPIKGKNKVEMIEVISKFSKKQKSIGTFDQNLNAVILKRSKKSLGKCCRVSKLERKIFLRVLLLFSLVNCNDDDDEVNWNRNPLLMITLVNIKSASFPKYVILKEKPLFENRKEVIDYTEALAVEGEMINAIEKKDWDAGLKLLEHSFTLLQSVTRIPLLDKKQFFHRFTANQVYCRCVAHGIDILQKIRNYKEAVKKLQWLIYQKVTIFRSRGYWYDRLALNLDQHLKQPEKALSTIKEGLDQVDLREHQKLSLSIRAKRILNSSSFKKKFPSTVASEFSLITLPSIPDITIQGKLLPQFADGINTVFIKENNLDSNETDFTVCSVETVALDHYAQNGFIDGIHGEGSSFITIYSLLFWDIIYGGNVADVFRVPHQAYPLDLNSDCFYESRKNAIDCHLLWLSNSTNEEIIQVIKKNWQDYQGIISLVKWDRFNSIDHLLSLVNCLNGKMLSSICSNFSKDYRTFRSGFPDLVVWNSNEMKVKIIEVKGPGDRLSTKQMIWLNHLMNAKIPCEVCYVEGISTKKLKKRKNEEN